MSFSKQDSSSGLNKIWEDLVNDFLELRSRLTLDERSELIDELRQRGVQARAIKPHACFSVDGRIVIVSEDMPRKEFWIIDSRQKKIKRHLFRGNV